MKQMFEIETNAGLTANDVELAIAELHGGEVTELRSDLAGAKKAVRVHNDIQPICPNCRWTIAPGYNFCSGCGSPLDWGK